MKSQICDGSKPISRKSNKKKSPLKVVSCKLQKPFLQETFFEEGSCVSPYVRSEFLEGNIFKKNFRLLTENQSCELDGH